MWRCIKHGMRTYICPVIELNILLISYLPGAGQCMSERHSKYVSPSPYTGYS